MPMVKWQKNEYPCVYHNNGCGWLTEINRGWIYFKTIENRFFSDKTIYQKFKKPDNLDIVLCHNLKEKSLTERSLEYIGIYDYRVFGQDIISWHNFNKIELVLDYLLNRCKTEFILHLDAADVIICDDPQRILDRFLSEFHCDVLFNGEKNSAPGSHLPSVIVSEIDGISEPPNTDTTFNESELEKIKNIEKFEVSKYDSPFKHLNSGCYIGRREALIELFKEAVTLKGFITSGIFAYSDQPLIRELHRRFYPKVMVDYKCRIFQAMFLVNKNEVKSRYPISVLDTTLIILKVKARACLRSILRCVGLPGYRLRAIAKNIKLNLRKLFFLN